MPKFKNISKRKIRIIHDGRRIVLSPNQTINGPSFLGSYKGLAKIEDDVYSEQITNTITPPLAAEQITNTIKPPLAEILVEEFVDYDFEKISVVVEDIENEDATIRNLKKDSELIEYNVLKNGEIMKKREKIDLSDVTFTIPISIESEDRRNNLITLLDYLNKHFHTNVIICESGKTIKIKDFWKPEWASFVKCLFIENKTDYFYKTRLLNKMAKLSKTPIITSYDSDVLMYPNQYVDAANSIRNGVFDFCYPFNKPLKHIERQHFKIIKETLDLHKVDSLSVITHQGVPPGGCLFMNKDKFIEAGMENENFISWGPEDQERIERVKILGYKTGSIDGYLFHMDHIITHNSSYSNPLYRHNLKEFEKVKRMTKEQLKDYIKTWSHLNG